MQQKIHMQDQINNRIDMIMGDRHGWFKQVIDDLVTFGFVITILAIGIIW